MEPVCIIAPISSCVASKNKKREKMKILWRAFKRRGEIENFSVAELFEQASRNKLEFIKSSKSDSRSKKE